MSTTKGKLPHTNVCPLFGGSTVTLIIAHKSHYLISTCYVIPLVLTSLSIHVIAYLFHSVF